jgi:hypothetical protein
MGGVLVARLRGLGRTKVGDVAEDLTTSCHGGEWATAGPDLLRKHQRLMCASINPGFYKRIFASRDARVLEVRMVRFFLNQQECMSRNGWVAKSSL